MKIRDFIFHDNFELLMRQIQTNLMLFRKLNFSVNNRNLVNCVRTIFDLTPIKQNLFENILF